MDAFERISDHLSKLKVPGIQLSLESGFSTSGVKSLILICKSIDAEENKFILLHEPYSLEEVENIIEGLTVESIMLNVNYPILGISVVSTDNIADQNDFYDLMAKIMANPNPIPKNLRIN